MIIRAAINDAYLELKKKNIESYILDSEILMSKVLNKDRNFTTSLKLLFLSRLIFLLTIIEPLLDS